MGTLGVVALGVKKGLLPAIDPILDSLEQNGFRFSERVRTKIKEKIGK
jgi:predicted nucleic acid-binding protein